MSARWRAPEARAVSLSRPLGNASSAGRAGRGLQLQSIGQQQLKR